MLSRNNRALGFAAGIAALALTLTACGSSSGSSTSDGGDGGKANTNVVTGVFGGQALDNGKPAKGGTLRMASSAPIDALDPAGFMPAGAGIAGQAVFGALMRYSDASGSLEAGLAESLETADHENWTLTLRPGLKFTDGTAFDTAAVLAHWDRFKADDSVAFHAGRFRSQVKSYKAVDDLKIEITTNGQQFDFGTLLTNQAGMVPSPKAVKAKSFAQNPVGAGPFKVSAFKPGGDLDLVRNPEYFDAEHPYLDGLKFVTVPTSQGRISAIRAGDIDAAVTMSPADTKAATSAGLTTLKQGINGYWYMLLNNKKAPFDDVSVRRAVLQAMDMAGINASVFSGEAAQAKSWIPSGNSAFVASDKFPEFDVAAAKKAVADYKAKGGKPTFEALALGTEDYQRLMAVLQQMLSDVDITMTIKTVDLPTQASAAGTGEYQAQMRFATVPWAVGSDMWSRFHTTSPANQTKGGSPELDKVLDSIVATEPTKTGDLWKSFADTIVEVVPFVPILEQAAVWVLDDKVGGFPGAGGEITWEQMTRVDEIWMTK